MALVVEQSNGLKMDEPSPHVWSAPAFPSQRTPAPEDPQDPCFQIMYSKEQVYQGDNEFSLEELRAERYYRERASHLNRMKQELQLQIEQKQKLLQWRQSSAAPQEVVHEEADSSAQMSAGSCESGVEAVKSAPFKIYSEQDEGCVDTSKSLSREDEINQSDAKPQKTVTAKPFAIFDENMQTNKISSSASRKSLKMPTFSLKVPKPKADLSADKEASISRSEEPIINGHWNKSVCRSPDDTCDFIRAAQLASTPFAGVERSKVDSHSPIIPECTAAANTEPTAEEKKLSPILEISQEWGATSFATFSQEPKHFGGAEMSQCVEEPELENVSRSADVFAPDVRSRLLDQADVTSFSNFHRKAGLLPDTSNDLELDGELMYYCGKRGDFSLYSSRASPEVLVKTDSSQVSWDFFIMSQLRSRRSHDDQDGDVQVSCHAYENGCLMVWTLPPGDILQDLLGQPIPRLDAYLLVLHLLELLQRFHSCRVILGGLKLGALFVHRSGITALDFSDSVDLELQTDVTTAQALPVAKEDIQHGLLTPTASPYQVDLLDVAKISHQLLFNRALSVTQDECGWRLQEDSGLPVEPFWRDFFHMILNPEKPSVLVLSDLIQYVTKML